MLIAASVVAGAAVVAATDELESSSLPQAVSSRRVAAATATTRVSDFVFINGALPRVPKWAALGNCPKTAS